MTLTMDFTYKKNPQIIPTDPNPYIITYYVDNINI